MPSIVPAVVWFVLFKRVRPSRLHDGQMFTHTPLGEPHIPCWLEPNSTRACGGGRRLVITRSIHTSDEEHSAKVRNVSYLEPKLFLPKTISLNPTSPIQRYHSLPQTVLRHELAERLKMIHRDGGETLRELAIALLQPRPREERGDFPRVAVAVTLSPEPLLLLPAPGGRAREREDGTKGGRSRSRVLAGDASTAEKLSSKAASEEGEKHGSDGADAALSTRPLTRRRRLLSRLHLGRRKKATRPPDGAGGAQLLTLRDSDGSRALALTAASASTPGSGRPSSVGKGGAAAAAKERERSLLGAILGTGYHVVLSWDDPAAAQPPPFTAAADSAQKPWEHRSTDSPAAIYGRRSAGFASDKVAPETPSGIRKSGRFTLGGSSTPQAASAGALRHAESSPGVGFAGGGTRSSVGDSQGVAPSKSGTRRVTLLLSTEGLDDLAVTERAARSARPAHLPARARSAGALTPLEQSAARGRAGAGVASLVPAEPQSLAEELKSRDDDAQRRRSLGSSPLYPTAAHTTASARRRVRPTGRIQDADSRSRGSKGGVTPTPPPARSVSPALRPPLPPIRTRVVSGSGGSAEDTSPSSAQSSARANSRKGSQEILLSPTAANGLQRSSILRRVGTSTTRISEEGGLGDSAAERGEGRRALVPATAASVEVPAGPPAGAGSSLAKLKSARQQASLPEGLLSTAAAEADAALGPAAGDRGTLSADVCAPAVSWAATTSVRRVIRRAPAAPSSPALENEGGVPAVVRQPAPSVSGAPPRRLQTQSPGGGSSVAELSEAFERRRRAAAAGGFQSSKSGPHRSAQQFDVSGTRAALLGASRSGPRRPGSSRLGASVGASRRHMSGFLSAAGGGEASGAASAKADARRAAMQTHEEQADAAARSAAGGAISAGLLVSRNYVLSLADEIEQRLRSVGLGDGRASASAVTPRASGLVASDRSSGGGNLNLPSRSGPRSFAFTGVLKEVNAVLSGDSVAARLPRLEVTRADRALEKKMEAASLHVRLDKDRSKTSQNFLNYFAVTVICTIFFMWVSTEWIFMAHYWVPVPSLLARQAEALLCLTPSPRGVAPHS